jgi:hypothetical protein
MWYCVVPTFNHYGTDVIARSVLRDEAIFNNAIRPQHPF